MIESHRQGSITEGVVISEFLKRGLTVLVPFGYLQRYDVVVEVCERFYKIQCKTGRERNGAVVFNACSSDNVTHKRHDYRGQIDFFAVLEPVSNKVYLVDPYKVSKNQGYLRTSFKYGTDRKRCNKAEDFLLDAVLKSLGEAVVKEA